MRELKSAYMREVNSLEAIREKELGGLEASVRALKGDFGGEDERVKANFGC